MDVRIVERVPYASHRISALSTIEGALAGWYHPNASFQGSVLALAGAPSLGLRRVEAVDLLRCREFAYRSKLWSFAWP
jgi:hypothetical protein